jgi:hypothetical protein
MSYVIIVFLKHIEKRLDTWDSCKYVYKSLR